MSGELRAQRREPCVESGWAADKRCNPRLFNGDQRCDGCNGDGTRWVTVGTLRHGRNSKYGQEGAYIAGTFCGFIDDESDEYGRCADGFYVPLYVIEDPGEATT